MTDDERISLILSECAAGCCNFDAVASGWLVGFAVALGWGDAPWRDGAYERGHRAGLEVAAQLGLR